MELLISVLRTVGAWVMEDSANLIKTDNSANECQIKAKITRHLHVTISVRRMIWGDVN